MFELLRDPMWQFIGAIVAFIAIIITIIIYLKQRRNKLLNFEIISRTPLLSIEDEIKGNLQILYNGNPIEQVHLIVIKFINSGNTPITSNDFEIPINFKFGEESQIFTAEITEKNPTNLRASITIEGNSIVIDPTLLNSGDSITIKTLVSRFVDIDIDGRIIGVKEIKEYEEGILPFVIPSIIGFIFTLYGMWIITMFPAIQIFRGIFFFLVGYFMLIVSIMIRTKFRKKFFEFIRSL